MGEGWGSWWVPTLISSLGVRATGASPWWLMSSAGVLGLFTDGE